MKRRTFLKAGAAFLVAVAGGGVYRAAQQGVWGADQANTYELWRTWRDAASGTGRIVRAGILAANPHNAQPWYFHIGEQSIDLYADGTRQIGAVDPLQRELHIGLGCAVENMILAAQMEGFATQLTLLPNAQDTTHVAHLALARATVQTPGLANAIPLRHTNRGPYDQSKALDEDTLHAFNALCDDPAVHLMWYTQPAERLAFGNGVVAGAEALVADEQQSSDSHQWWRQSWQAVQTHRDGLTVDGQTFDELTRLGAKMLPDVSRQESDAFFVKTTREVLVATAPAFGLIALNDQDDNAQRMQAGRLWQRMHLWATLHGLAMQPINQMCERADRERQLGLDASFGRALRDLVGSDDRHAVMMFRAGYPLRQALPSPRRAVNDVLR